MILNAIIKRRIIHCRIELDYVIPKYQRNTHTEFCFIFIDAVWQIIKLIFRIKTTRLSLLSSNEKHLWALSIVGQYYSKMDYELHLNCTATLKPLYRLPSEQEFRNFQCHIFASYTVSFLSTNVELSPSGQTQHRFIQDYFLLLKLRPFLYSTYILVVHRYNGTIRTGLPQCCIQIEDT